VEGTNADPTDVAQVKHIFHLVFYETHHAHLMLKAKTRDNYSPVELWKDITRHINGTAVDSAYSLNQQLTHIKINGPTERDFNMAIGNFRILFNKLALLDAPVNSIQQRSYLIQAIRQIDPHYVEQAGLHKLTFDELVEEYKSVINIRDPTNAPGVIKMNGGTTPLQNTSGTSTTTPNPSTIQPYSAATFPERPDRKHQVNFGRHRHNRYWSRHRGNFRNSGNRNRRKFVQ